MHKNESTGWIILNNFFVQFRTQVYKKMSTRKRNRNGDFIGEEADHQSVSAHDPNSSANQSY